MEDRSWLEHLDRGRTLVMAAFEQARASGRVDWAEMTVAVLKNRLLTITNRSFNEGDYNAANLAEFVGLFPDELEIIPHRYPLTVRLKNPSNVATSVSPTAQEAPPHVVRIREDLWRAVVRAPKRGRAYVWDRSAGLARQADPGDPNPVLPSFADPGPGGLRGTFYEEELERLRHEPSAQARVIDWYRQGYQAAYLAPASRRRWAAFLSQAVLDRLGDFFSSNDIVPPDDLVSDSQSRTPTEQRQLGTGSGDLGGLRALVHQCVAVMTEQELSDLRISPAVMLRASRRR